MDVKLDETERKEVFFMLVGLQDGGLNVEQSRKKVSEYFNLPVAEVAAIEQEGIDKSWPPLESCV